MPRRVDKLAELDAKTRLETVQVNVRVPKEVHEALRVLVAATGQPANEIVLRALRNYLATDGHRAAVRAFAEQATKQYAVALDKLKDL
jgi:predicted DNA-binding protein